MSAGRGLGRHLSDRRLTLVLRLAAGAVLVFASHDKLLDPQPFADALDDYRILPLALVDLVAIVLPWVELVAGVCLLAGLWVPGAGLVTATLAIVYTGALTSALLRGLEIGCGCFGDEGEVLSRSDLWLRLALFAAGVQVLATARFLDWPLAALSSRASRRRRATGPTPDS